MHLVDQPGAKVLLNRMYSAANPHVQTSCRVAGAFKRTDDAVGDKVERGTAVHEDRLSVVVRQHEDLGVIRRVVAPPAFPARVGPRSSYWPEHVAPQNPGADIAESASGEVLVEAGCAGSVPCIF